MDMESILNERVNAVIHSIFSGDNACSTLINAISNRDERYFRCPIEAGMRVYMEEARQLIADRDTALRDAELKRYALETVVSNCDISNPVVKEALKNALPNHPLLG